MSVQENPLRSGGIFAAFASLVETLITGLDAQSSARQHNVPLADFASAYDRVQPHLWHGRLSLALAQPDQRPDLLPQLNRLAALEYQYTSYILQKHRAHELCEEARNQKNRNLLLIMKAEAFAFRVQQAVHRTLKDMEKAEIRYEKSLACPLPTPTPTDTKEPSPIPTRCVSEEAPSIQAPSVSEEASPIPTRSVSEEEASIPIRPAQDESPQNTSETPPATTLPNSALQALLMKNRERLKNTPAKDRQELIAKLVREHFQNPRAAA